MPFDFNEYGIERLLHEVHKLLHELDFYRCCASPSQSNTPMKDVVKMDNADACDHDYGRT